MMIKYYKKNPNEKHTYINVHQNEFITAYLIYKQIEFL